MRIMYNINTQLLILHLRDYVLQYMYIIYVYLASSQARPEIRARI